MSIADEVVVALEVASVYMLPEKDSSSKWKVLKWQDAERIIRAAIKDVEADLERLRLNIRSRVLIDATPDDGLVARILSAYIDESYTTDNTLGLPPDNPLCVVMNEAQEKRNTILRKALAVEADRADLLESLEDMVRQHAYHDAADDTYDSQALSATADAMRLLAGAGRCDILEEFGRRVFVRFKEG